MFNPIRITAVDRHIRQFFEGHSITEQQWTLGPHASEMTDFQVLRVAPGKRTHCWTYLSKGASVIEHEDGGLVEFLITAPAAHDRHVELLTMVAWYHKSTRLGLGHTVPIGGPWLEKSLCDYLLVSLPYSFGHQLEICNIDDGHIHFHWLLPITKAEREFKITQGIEALEQQFEKSELEYWNPFRQSVV